MSPWKVLRACAAVLRDRVRIPRPPRGQRAPLRLVVRIRLATAERRYEQAVPLAEGHLSAYGRDRVFLKEAVAAFGKAGALTPHREAAELLAEAEDTADARRRAALVAGRWLETSGWMPAVPGEPGGLRAAEGTVLHLLKISRPYRESGYSLRSQYTLEGQLSAGLRPVGVTALGFPRQLGVADFPREQEVGGVRYLRLDPGPDYDFDGPVDDYLIDYAAAAASVVRAEAPSVIHVHSGHRGYEAALVGLALGRHFGLPVVYEVRGFFESLWTADSRWSERSEVYRRRLETENRCMAQADAVVTLSESMRAEIVARGIPAERVHVVPNGVDVDAFQPRARDAGLVERYRLGDAFTFGYISNLDHYREGQELLIGAAAELRRRGIEAKALIVGDGKRRAELERIAAGAQAGDAVVFTGKVPHEQVLDFYGLLDVFVIPRADERAARLVTPLKPFEAMAAGVPLVTSDLAALREITGDGRRGRYFPAGDATGLADILAELHADPSAREQMAARARDWVVAERQWSANGERYARIYRSLR